MFERLHESALPFLAFASQHYTIIMFALYSLLMYFFLVSRRLQARAVAPPAPRRLRRLALALTPGETPRRPGKGPKKKPAAGAHKKKIPPPPLPPGLIAFLQEIRLHRLLQKIDWLLHEKPKLLPDTRTGRRFNYFFMLFIVWLVIAGKKWIGASGAMGMVGSSRAQPGQMLSFFLVPLYVLLLYLPFLLIKNNRELYFDMGAVLVLLQMTFPKLVNCWRTDCCYGIPWQHGVFNEKLHTATFPVQLFEFAVGALCAVLCVFFMLYAKSYRPGRGCSLCLLSYVVPRFFWEYLRYHDGSFRTAGGPFGLTMAQAVCVAGAALAVAWWLALPLEKKWMDRFGQFLGAGLRRAASTVPFFAKWQAWSAVR